MLFYARSCLYSASRRAVTKSTRSVATLIPRRTRPPTDIETERTSRVHFQPQLQVTERRNMATIRKLLMFYLAPPQMVHFPEEKVKQASYSYRKSMRKPYQTSLHYKIQRGIHAVRPSSVRINSSL